MTPISSFIRPARFAAFLSNLRCTHTLHLAHSINWYQRTLGAKYQHFAIPLSIDVRSGPPVVPEEPKPEVLEPLAHAATSQLRFEVQETVTKNAK